MIWVIAGIAVTLVSLTVFGLAVVIGMLSNMKKARWARW